MAAEVEEQLELDGMPEPLVDSEPESIPIPAWVPTICPHCDGSGMAPGDGPTECGFCVDGKLTEDLRAELNRVWGGLLERHSRRARRERKNSRC